MDIRVRKPYPYEVRPGVTRTLPASWTGTVNDVVGQAAIDIGSAVRTDDPARVDPPTFTPPVGPFAVKEKGPGWWILTDGPGEQIGKAIRKTELDGFDGFSDEDKLAFAIEHAKA